MSDVGLDDVNDLTTTAEDARTAKPESSETQNTDATRKKAFYACEHPMQENEEGTHRREPPMRASAAMTPWPSGKVSVTSFFSIPLANRARETMQRNI